MISQPSPSPKVSRKVKKREKRRIAKLLKSNQSSCHDEKPCSALSKSESVDIRESPIPTSPSFVSASSVINHGHGSKGYTVSKKVMVYHDETNNTVNFLERTGVEVDPVVLEEAGLDVEILDSLPQQPRWFPRHIKYIFNDFECPQNVSFTSLLHLTKYRTFLAKQERKKWKIYIRFARMRLGYDIRLDEYLDKSAPMALILDCRCRAKFYKQEAATAMSKLDRVVQGTRYFDRIMEAIYRNERHIYMSGHEMHET